MLDESGVTQAISQDVPEDNSSSAQDAELLNAYLAQEEGTGETQGEDSPTTAGQEDSQEQQPELFTVKVDGEEKQVSKDELIANYSKATAADKRFNEAAEIRKAAETKAQALESEQAKLQNALNYFSNTVQQWQTAGLLQPPDIAMLDTDPVSYLRQKGEYESRLAEIQKAEAAQSYLQQQQERTQQERLANFIEQENQKLPQLLPEWENEDTKAKEVKKLTDYMLGQGYTHDDILSLNTSSASTVAMVVKAMRFDELVSKAKSGANKVSNLPQRVIKGGTNNAPNVDQLQTAKARLMKSGSQQDAADYFSQLFGG